MNKTRLVSNGRREPNLSGKMLKEASEIFLPMFVASNSKGGRRIQLVSLVPLR